MKKLFNITVAGYHFCWQIYSCHVTFHLHVHVCLWVAFCTDREREKAKERYIKATLKLHEHHNEYVLSVKAAQVHHQLHYGQSQPALLGALQTLQEEMVLILWVNINNTSTIMLNGEISPLTWVIRWLGCY